MPKKVLYIATTLPALTLTFVYREIWALERRGIDVSVVSMNRPRRADVSEEAYEFYDRTTYLDQVSLARKLLATLRLTIFHPGAMARAVGQIFSAKPKRFPKDYLRLVYHFVEASFLYFELKDHDFSHIHSHIISGPTSIGMFLSTMSGIPFSFTMHGPQIYLNPVGLIEKLERCKTAVSVSEYHRDYVLDTYGQQYANKFEIVRCGLELDQFPERRETQSGKPMILGVGRLVPIKGFTHLIQACRQLADAGIEFDCRIVGDGPSREALESEIRKLDLTDLVHLEGAKTQGPLKDYFRRASVFVLPCVVDKEGGRDGIPVAIMEAMAWRIPVITSALVGIPELVAPDVHGLLVPPEDSQGVAAAIESVLKDRTLAEQLSASGREQIEREFNVDASAGILEEIFFGSSGEDRTSC